MYIYNIYRVSCIAMRRALFSAHIQSPEPNHWCCYVDAAGLTGDEPDTPLPLSLPALHPEATSSTPAPMTSTTTEENSSITDAASTAEEIGMSTTFSTFESSQAGTQNSNNAMFFQHGVSLTEDELEVVSSLIDLCPDTSEASPAQDKSVAVMGGSEQSTTPVPLSIQPPTTDITISIPTNTNSTAAANNGIQKVPSYQFINGSYFFIQSVVNTEVHTPHSGKVVADEEQIREMHRLMKLFPSNSVPASVNLDKDGNATYTSTLTRQTSSATITMTKTTSHHHYHHSHHNDATEVVGSKRVLERVTKDVSINDIPIADEEKKKLSENNEDSTSGSDVEEDVVIEVIKRARPNRQEETTTIFETHSVEHHPHSHAQQ